MALHSTNIVRVGYGVPEWCPDARYIRWAMNDYGKFSEQVLMAVLVLFSLLLVHLLIYPTLQALYLTGICVLGMVWLVFSVYRRSKS